MRSFFSLILTSVLLVSCSSKSTNDNGGRVDPYETTDLDSKIIIPYTESNGVKEVEVKLNGTPLKMIWDTGASTSLISIEELARLFKSGSITLDDFIDTNQSLIADGSISVGMVFRIRELEILGNNDKSIKLSDMNVSVIDNINAPLLLGTDATDALGRKYTINPELQAIEFAE